MPLSKRASLEAQRMMREAFIELERIITVSDRAQLKNLSLEDVQQAALQVEKQLAASQSLRNMRRLAPLFTGLGYYSQSIEVLCNGTPYLPWLWAPIKLVLKISADYIEAFEQIIKVYSRLAEPLARFSLFDRSFSNNIEVQNTLAVYYSDILKFHGEAYKFVRRNAWQRLFATSWGRFQRRFDNIFADLKAHEDLVDKTVNAANLSEAKEMREKLEDWRQQEIAKLKKEEEERTSTEFRAVLSVLKVDETHQIKVFDNLTSEANRNPGSCGWILQQPKIRSWVRCERDTQFVVLHGFVGSGKSILAAQIATFLRASERSLVAAHFCTYLYPESTDYSYIMRSLMIQIIRLDPELITLSYDWLVLKKKAPSNAIVEQLLRLLVEAMGALPEKQKTLHVIIDGLDECDDNTVASVVKTLDKLVATASSSTATLLKVLLCTQMRPEVVRFVKKKHQVSLSSEKDNLNKAIQDYTLQRINAIRPSLSQLRITDDDVTALASQITQKADGMFLWAKLVMEYINKNLFYHRDEILKAATSLPRELGDFYGRMLSQIMANFDERSAQRISAVLSWIAFAKRPLRLAELLSALAFDTKQEQVDELVPAYILDRCEPLIQKQADSSYSFVHVSVRDFLQSSDTALLVTELESQRRHGLATVRCLLSGQQIFAPLYPGSERVLRVFRGLHGFHMYATEFWVDYLLASLEFDQDQFFESDLFALSCRLAQNFTGSKTDCEAVDGSLSDSRLTLIQQKDYPLYKVVKMVLLEQNKETIEVTSIHDDTIRHDDMASDIIALKKRYQTTIQKLLNYSTYPGISFQQLEQFKQNFRTSAFTCRLWSCPYATLGFSNLDSLTRHEAEHAKHICRVQGCQYPVFNSARLLKNHVAEHHTNRDQQLKRKSIRKRRALISPIGPKYVSREVDATEESPYQIKCICDFSGDDGNTIYCETCDTWQHILCFYPDNPEEAMREDFSHSCDVCKPRLLRRRRAVERIKKIKHAMLRQSAIRNRSNIPSLLNDSSRPLAADIPRQTTPRTSPASPPPPVMVTQNSKIGPQAMEYSQQISEGESQRTDLATRQAEEFLFTSAHSSPGRSRPQSSGSIAGKGSRPLLDSDAHSVQSQVYPWHDYSLGTNLESNNVAFPVPNVNPLHVIPSQTHFANNANPDVSYPSDLYYFPPTISRPSSPIYTSVDEASEPFYSASSPRFAPLPDGWGFHPRMSGQERNTIPPRLNVGGPPTPTLPLTGADLQSTLPDPASANHTPGPPPGALYIGSSSHRGLPVSFVDATSSPPSLPPLGPNGPVKRACDACTRGKVKCDGTEPCYNCSSAWLSCTYNAIPRNESPSENSQMSFFPTDEVNMPLDDFFTDLETHTPTAGPALPRDSFVFHEYSDLETLASSPTSAISEY
ncbi:hypothetical protein GGI35DRAFT_161583 [Trichoderma velutinum]